MENNNYFEYNFPMTAPDYFSEPLKDTYEKVARRVADRMDMLADALDACQEDATRPMTAEQFAATAKKVFDMSPDQFDSLGWEKVAATVNTLFDGTPVESRLVFPNAITLVDAAFITVKEWETFRHLGIGGSDSAVVQGTSVYNTERHLYHDKCGTPKKIPDAEKSIYERGHTLEPKVIQAFAKAKGVKKLWNETRMFQSMTCPHCIADVDAVVELDNGELYIFEAKTTVEGNKPNWLRGGDGVPSYYVTQCRHYPAVLADDRIKGTYIGCLFVKDYELGGEYVGSVYDPRDFLSRLVERNPSSEGEILMADEDFFYTYIIPGVEPPANAVLTVTTENGYKSSELQDVKLARSLNGPVDKDLPPMEIMEEDLKELAREYLSIQAQKSLYQQKVDSLNKALAPMKVEFTKRLGVAAKGIIDVDDDNFVEIKNTPKCGKSVDYDTLSVKYPEAYAECVTVSEAASHVFSLALKNKAEEAKKAAKRGKKKAS